MTVRDRGISVLNSCLEWDKFVRLTLTYPTPDSCLTYTKTFCVIMGTRVLKSCANQVIANLSTTPVSILRYDDLNLDVNKRQCDGFLFRIS